MYEKGLKVTDFVSFFGLEVLNRGSDYETALLTITDVRDFTGIKDRRTVKRMFPFNSSNRISAATLAAYLSDQAAGGDGR